MTVAASIEDGAVLDEDGLLRVGESWIAIPDGQLPVVRLLLSNPRRVVRYDDIADCYGRAGGTARRSAVSSMLNRLATRVRAVGLDLVSVRSRGVMLVRSRRPRAEVGPGSDAAR